MKKTFFQNQNRKVRCLLQSTFFFVLCASILFAGPISVKAVGISPPSFTIDDFKVGTERVITINLSRPNPSKSQNASIEFNGDLAKLVSGSQKRSVILEKGVVNTELDLTLSSGRVGPGAYEGSVVISVESDEEDLTESGVQLVEAVQSNISITVTNESNKAFEILGVQYKETGYLEYIVKNSGNEPLEFTSFLLQVKKKGEEKYISEEPIELGGVDLIPGASQKIDQKVGELENGVYIAEVYANSDALSEVREFTFVVSKKTLIEKIVQEQGYIVPMATGVFFAVVVFVFVIKRRKR